MTSLTNINRDAFWSSLNPYLSADKATVFATLEARTHLITFENLGTIMHPPGYKPTVSNGEGAAIGVVFDPFADDEQDDNAMFRVKVMAGCEDPAIHRFWGHGYVTGFTGEYALMQNQTLFAVTGEGTDQIYALRRPPAGNPNEGLPVCFFVGIGETGGNHAFHGGISVQNMGVGPDPYAVANW